MDVRFIDTGIKDAFDNMAIDEALLESKEPVLRFYGWSPATLSLGYFQNTNDIDISFCKKNNIDIVRRITGGNAVLHEKELTYSVIIDESKMPESIIESYKQISKGLLEGLNILGIDAKMNKDVEKGIKSPVCFHDPSWYEITVDSKKIIGSAQKRVKGKILQHGAILIDIDISKYARCFKDPPRIENRITSIKDKNTSVTLEEVKTAMKKGFEKELHFKLIRSKLSEEELSRSNDLRDKYKNSAFKKMD